MRKERLVSIIVPVYNVEPYLKKCVNSILNQTYKNIEIILVDNGSTDNSGKICDIFATQDKRVVTYHKEHGNISTARNKGLELANGNWIGFVDADDWIETTMYQSMLENAEKENAQMVVCGFWKERSNYSVVMSNAKSIPTYSFNGEKALEYAFIRDEYRAFCAYVWNKLFCKDLIQDRWFDENIKSCEDVEYFARVASESDRVSYIENPFYHHLERDDSSWKIYYYEKRLTVLDSYQKIIDILEKKSMKKVSLYAKRFYAYHASLLMEFAIQNGEEDKFEEIKKHMKKYHKEYIKTNFWKFKYRNRYTKLMNYKK